MPGFFIKQFDRSRPLKVTLSTDLTGATVTFRMGDASGVEVVNAPAMIVTASVVIDGVTSAVVQYEWQAGDTDFSGRYRGEFVVTYSGGRQETFPADGYVDVVIADSVPLEEAADTFRIDTTGAETLCSDAMIRDLLEEVTEFPGSLYDAVNKLAELKVQARAWLQFYTGKWLGYRDVVDEKLDGNDRRFVVPRNTPILSVSLFAIDNFSSLVLGTDFWVYPDRLETFVTVPHGHQNVTLSYRAGTSVATDLPTAMAVARICALFVLGDTASGPSQSSAIQAGPVALRETFFAGGKYAKKQLIWTAFVNDYISQRRGARMAAVGYRISLSSTPRLYIPRLDRVE